MDIHYKFLKEAQIPEIHATFLEAFSDYSVDISYMTLEVIRKRVVKNGIDFDLSVGAFDNKKMVGFTLVGTDQFKGYPGVFDIMTGIIKEYRGKRIAGQMFNFSLSNIKKKGFKNFYLEVIRDNKMAVKAYEKVGFNITRELDCYEEKISELNLPEQHSPDIKIKTLDKSFLAKYQEFIDWEPSWENSIHSIDRIPDELIIRGAYLDNIIVGMIIYYPTINWILGLGVQKASRRKSIGSTLVKDLIKHLPEGIDTLKIMNVDGNDKGFSPFLSNLGFKQYAGQYEMSFRLTDT